MVARQIDATTRGLELIARGMSVRKAAQEVGVAASTLTRAKHRAARPAQGKQQKETS
jgi:transposase